MALADLAGLQLGSLPLVGAEEDLRTVDPVASVARAERHELALRAAAPSADYDDRAGYAALVRDFWDALRLANISGTEGVAVHARTSKNGVKNRLPRPWGAVRLAYLLVFWQHVRDDVGAVRLASLHRLLAYDLDIGGVGRRGQHPACAAADAHPLSASVKDTAAAVRRVSRQRLELTAEQRRAIAAFRKATGYRGVAFSGPVRSEPYVPGVRADGAAFSPLGGEGRYRWGLHKDLRGYPASWWG